MQDEGTEEFLVLIRNQQTYMLLHIFMSQFKTRDTLYHVSFNPQVH